MRTLSSTLLAAQKAMGDALVKVDFTKTSQTTRTYDNDATTNRILNLIHTESEWSQTAQVLVDNRDGNLTALALEGYLGTISYGYNTSEGDEYSACAPLEVIAQSTDTILRPSGDLLTVFSLLGVFDMMGQDEASAKYIPSDTNTDTCKTILTAIANKTMSCFTHCKSYTIVFDDEDRDTFATSLINTYQPKDFFAVSFRESRLSAFKKALTYTGDKARIERNTTTGIAEIHVFRPTPYADDWAASTVYAVDDKVKPTTENGFEYICTTAGTSHTAAPTWPTTEDSTVEEDTGVVWTIVWYDYEYNDSVTEHNFFNKGVRKRLVVPNKIVVSSHPDHSPSYTGSATDPLSYDALGRYVTEHKYIRAASNTQCDNIASAIQQNYTVGAEKGHGLAPMNCGQEVMDYVLITDSVASDTRTGNIGYLSRKYSPGTFEFEFRFGALELGYAGLAAPQITTITTGGDLSGLVGQLRQAYFNLSADVLYNMGTINLIKSYLNLSEMPKLHVTHQLIIPVIIPDAPTVTTQAVSDIAATTATGNGTITDLGVPDPTAHGVCWNTTGTPTTSDSKTDEGAATLEGAYTTDMTDLIAETKYYVRAYATNDKGTTYGRTVTFTTGAA